MRAIIAAMLVGCAPFPMALAQGAGVCGDPPPVANEALKGEIRGKAQFLSRFVGNTELAGRIETSRTEIFSKYPDAEQSRSNAYFEYQVCVLIMTDTSKSPSQKLEALQNMRREFGKPVKSKHSVIIQSGRFFIDNHDFGLVSGNRSWMDWTIDGKSIVDGEWRLNSTFGSHALELAEGEHTFEVQANVVSREEPRTLKDSCGGTFVVTGSGVYEPSIKLVSVADRSGKITSCTITKRP